MTHRGLAPGVVRSGLVCIGKILGQRRRVVGNEMKAGSALVNYSLFSNSGRTTNWGNTVGTDTVSGTGIGSAQSLTVYGRIPPQTTPSPGTYGLQVVYFSAKGATNPATNAQLRIYAQGVLAADLTHAFTKVGEVWNAGAVTWPSGAVTP